MKPRLLVLVAIVAFVAAVAGVFLGRHFLPHPVASGVELHDVLHSKLDLDARQKAQIELLEQRFAVRRRALALELSADNARLAEAIETEHGNGTGVAAEIGKASWRERVCNDV